VTRLAARTVPSGINNIRPTPPGAEWVSDVQDPTAEAFQGIQRAQSSSISGAQNFGKRIAVMFAAFLVGGGIEPGSAAWGSGRSGTNRPAAVGSFPKVRKCKNGFMVLILRSAPALALHLLIDWCARKPSRPLVH
jgi:hypothetical protein